jgi:ATP-dependent helicase/nuclease subunit A
VNKGDANSWYQLIKAGLDGLLTAHEGLNGAKLSRMESKQMKAVERPEAAARVEAAATLPEWALKAAPPERARRKIAPSRLALGLEARAEVLGPEQTPLGPLALSENNRYVRGRLVHALLQHMPDVAPEHQERAARSFVAARGADLSHELQEEIVAETLAVIGSAIFAPLFQPGSLAEVPVVARIGGYDLEGQIDRLARLDDGLLILDYKTNRPPPKTVEEVAPAYIAQLTAYRIALKGLYPKLPLRAALLWTDGPRLMEIPSTSLDAAEERLLGATAEP